MLLRNWFPSPLPLLAPLSDRQYRKFKGCINGFLWVKQLHQTVDSIIRHFHDSNVWLYGRKRVIRSFYLAFCNALNNVDLPTLGNPTIPAVNGIYYPSSRFTILSFFSHICKQIRGIRYFFQSDLRIHKLMLILNTIRREMIFITTSFSPRMRSKIVKAASTTDNAVNT